MPPKRTEHLHEIALIMCDAFMKNDKPHNGPHNINPMIEGSFGLQLHGVNFPEGHEPDDIDIFVSNQVTARKSLLQMNKYLAERGYPYQITHKMKGTHLSNVEVVDKTGEHPPIKVQLVFGADYGIVGIKPDLKSGLPVLPGVEALYSLIDRMCRKAARPKDQYAFAVMTLKHGEKLLAHPHLGKKISKENRDAMRALLDAPKEQQQEIMENIEKMLEDCASKGMGPN